MKIGTGLVAITVPPGALASAQTITLAAYASNPASKPFARRAMAPQGATFLLGFTVDAGGAKLYKPLNVSFASSAVAAAIPKGNVLRLAMFGTKSQAYTDVDTANVSGLTVTNDSNPAYVGISTASADNPYALYAVPSGAAATPAPIALSATTTSAQPFPIQSTATFVASGVDGNGNTYAFVPSYSLDSGSVGSISSQNVAPYDAVLQTGNTSAQGNLIVSDASRNLSGKTMVSVGSQRPANNGDTYAYSGTWSQTFDRNGQVPVTTTAALSQVVSVSSGATFNNVGNLYDFKAVQTAVANLATSTATYHTYNGYDAASTPVSFSLYGSTADDGNANTSTTTYANAQLIDRLPEQPGDTWTNDGAQRYLENDASGDTDSLTYATNGTYTDTQTFVETSIYPNSQAVLTENADGSGSIAIDAYSFPYSVVYTAPSSGTINISIPNPNNPSSPYYATSVAAWFSSNPTLHSETDTNLGNTALPSACNVGSGIPTTANKIEQVITRLDTIAGFTETETVDSYDVQGYGPVCSVMSDVLTSYYNLQGDVATSLGLAWYSTPYQTTTTTQTLSLQSAQVIGSARAMSGSARVAHLGAFAVARNAFDERLRRQRRQQIGRFVRALSAAISRGAVR